MVELDNPWILWSHSIDDNNWKKKSYKKLYKINNLYDYNILKDIINTNNLQNTMLFLMRENIYPMWEDPENRMGCCASYKIPNDNILETWNKLTLNSICENIMKTIKDCKDINGISIAPKKEFNILKIWFKTNIEDMNKVQEFSPYIIESNCRIKKHIIE